MGGKDSTIVTADCDLDAAVEGVVAAAFGFSGQKCSACSRAIVDRNRSMTSSSNGARADGQITVGDPASNPNMGPVINDASLRKTLKYIEIGKSEGRLIAGGEAIETAKMAATTSLQRSSPTSSPNARIAQEEIFGPVLAIIKANAILKTRSPSPTIPNTASPERSTATTAPNSIRPVKDFHVGNLYLNRKCTGAMVGAHPFGGFNMSGTDSKAGGPDYLYLFTQAKSVAEKL